MLCDISVGIEAFVTGPSQMLFLSISNIAKPYHFSACLRLAGCIR